MSESRRKPLVLCAAVYLIAAAVGIFVGIVTFRAASGNPVVSASVTAAAMGDIAATVVVFIFSVIFNNSSVYDPYWSVAPPFIAAYWIIIGIQSGSSIGLGGLLIVGALLVWALRLTHNWARGWRGFAHEDWRYVDFRSSTGRAYWLVSFLGIHLFPTILVFLGCLSLLPALAAPSHSFDALWIVGLLITAVAIWVETRSDRELFEFKRNRREGEEILETGLWAYSRHPNYFGEVLFWWGIYITGLAANSAYWWTIVGPLAMTALFLFISVPMMERHMIERHPSYEAHRLERSRFIPWMRR